MPFLSDAYIFPLFQVALLGCLAWCFGLDRPGGAQVAAGFRAGVIRGDASMKILGVTAGFATTVVALINNTALKEEMWLKDYSVLFNVLDVGAILYMCFLSQTGRWWIFHSLERARIEP